MISWKIGGEQGEGIDSTGDVLALVANRIGYYVYGYKSFSSRIKGGHTTYTVRIAEQEVAAAADGVDLLVALDQDTINLHAQEVSDGLIIADEAFHPTFPSHLGALTVALPLSDLARAHGSLLMRNMVAVGASAAFMGLPADPFLAYIDKRFRTKGAELVEQNQAAFLAGYRQKDASKGNAPGFALGPPAPGRRLLVTGNQALALGAVAGGCRLMFGYPITPATDIMEALARWLPPVGGAVVQMEDELGAITAAIGAGYAGARAMTATSGPGLSLMQEGIGLASMAEIPVVIVDTQRGGPSTGMPTKHEQSDLLAMIHGGHGDGPRIVLTPSSPEEAFEDGADAFNLADQLQNPVIIASDLALAVSVKSVAESDLDAATVTIDRGDVLDQDRVKALGEAVFLRYRLTESGISPRTLPGTEGGQYLATGVEHAQTGKVSEDPINREQMMEKRWRKIARLTQMRTGVRREGPAAPDVVLVGIGSTVGALKEAQRLLASEGYQVAVCWLRYIAPFPQNAFEAAIGPNAPILLVEHNARGQLGLILREAGVFDVRRYRTLLKYDGNPVSPQEVVAAARKLLTPVEVTPSHGNTR